jgi:hypothetical protein
MSTQAPTDYEHSPYGKYSLRAVWSDTVQYHDRGCSVVKQRLEATSQGDKLSLFASEENLRKDLLRGYEFVLTEKDNNEMVQQVNCAIDYLLEQKLVTESQIAGQVPHYTMSESAQEL